MENNTTIGHLLRNAREEKNISIEEIAKKTKVNINILRALEEDDLENLPNLAYVRGFVKSYAKAIKLNLDNAKESLEFTFKINENHNNVDQTEEDTDQSEGLKQETQTTHEKFEVDSSTEIQENVLGIIQSLFNKKILISLAVVAVLIVITSTVVNWFAELNFEKDNIAKTQVELKEEQQVTSQSNKTEDEDIEVPLDAETKPEIVAKVVEVEKKEPEVVKVEKKEPEVVKVEKKEPEVKEKKVIEPLNGLFPYKNFNPAPSNLFRVISDAPENSDQSLLPQSIINSTISTLENVYLVADEGDTWLSYKTDDNKIRRFVLKQGRRLFIKGEKVLLFIGNYRAVKIFYNNKLVKFKETSSGVKSLIFPESASKDHVLPLFPSYKGMIYTANEYIEKMEKTPQ